MELIEGLTLLSTEVQGEYAWVLYILACILGIVCAFLLWCLVDSFKMGEHVGVFLFSILLVLAMVVVLMAIGFANDPPTTVYKVTIDESVSMVEFYERYEILDQDGLIFTITEKDVS